MRPRFSIFINIPINTDTKNISIEAIEQRKEATVILTFRDIARTAFYYEDPSDFNRTILSIGKSKFSINMKRKSFDALLRQIEQDELFTTKCLN